MIMRDPYAGHRNYEDPWWTPDPIADTAWTDMDFALVEAARVVESFTSSTSGQLRWLSEDPEVYWETGETVDYATQHISRDGERYKDGVPPEVTIYAKNPTKKGDFWTMEEWFDFLDSDQARVDRDAPEGSHAPTAEDMRKIQEDREARLAAKWAETEED